MAVNSNVKFEWINALLCCCQLTLSCSCHSSQCTAGWVKAVAVKSYVSAEWVNAMLLSVMSLHNHIHAIQVSELLDGFNLKLCQ